MEERCIALKLLLDALSVPSQIETVADRKRVQKAVYLMQLTGLDLGYQYGWYLMGPYSPGLTRDYYDLAESLGEGDDEHKNVTLRAPVLESLKRITPLLTVPRSVPLEQPAWLELVASVHYLQKVRGLNTGAADEALKVSKPTLAPWFPPARQQLEACALLP